MSKGTKCSSACHGVVAAFHSLFPLSITNVEMIGVTVNRHYAFPKLVGCFLVTSESV